MTMNKILALIVTALIAAAQPASAQTPSATIRVEAPWARSTPPSARTAAAYMTLVNTGAEPDRLVSASSPVAGEAELHRSSNENGVMKMSPAGAIELPPGAPVVLSPGALHVMMMDMKMPLVDGQDFPLTLVFEKAGKVEVAVRVQRTAPSGATAMPGGGPVILSPGNGDTVSSPVIVIFDTKTASSAMHQMSGMAPAASGHMHGAAAEGGGHLHLIVDSPLPKAGARVPVDDRHIHLMDGETKATLTLPPGKHTLQLIRGGMDHKIPQQAEQSARVTITVQ
jgi:copper(I)-binding protein